jgi:phosphoenolpyruvate synthase/pyruvate phosphate dikinase
MSTIPSPIFEKDLPQISWMKIYEREYGVQYSTLAVSLLAFAAYHFPKLSYSQVVIPGDGKNTAFYIDKVSWNALVQGLNEKYSADSEKLTEYEKQFLHDGDNYLAVAKKIAGHDLSTLADHVLLTLFLEHQDKRNRYSVFAWSAFILNNYVADHATAILDTYIQKFRKENKRQEFIDVLFKPEKLAAVLALQREVEKYDGNISEKQLDNLYDRYKWLACLDIQNKPWTKNEFTDHIKSFTSKSHSKQISFEELLAELDPSEKDLEYLKIAKRFVYIKDARDDYRRESVFYSHNLWKELGRRMELSIEDTSYLLDEEIVDFLNGKKLVDKNAIIERKNGFVLYLGENKNVVCLKGEDIKTALKSFNLLQEADTSQEITGRVASKGKASGNVVIVNGIKDLEKFKKGNVLIAVTTHPDYVAAMRISAAIVTNEGGITSHAAIVSREYGIPCIVGTKNATKILRDGDLVEVDANNGTVKKLN